MLLDSHIAWNDAVATNHFSFSKFSIRVHPVACYFRPIREGEQTHRFFIDPKL
ncbi:hypothetical protein RBSWK_01361 [Rhodopirellula baltica SWK14]|uniref:Uncharacterized protein n=1 Tax=Rhodopirellula baltica SWK14 TaxID=993516 RepID=L7CKP7_RHOBT|nr:hypothetical protein RBSWK_01361 [Rhodopirellula baltica SWK14]